MARSVATDGAFDEMEEEHRCKSVEYHWVIEVPVLNRATIFALSTRL